MNTLDRPTIEQQRESFKNKKIDVPYFDEFHRVRKETFKRDLKASCDYLISLQGVMRLREQNPNWRIEKLGEDARG